MASLPPGPDVDVGVVTWNTAELTVPALRTLLDSQPGVRRLLVRDNGSTDGTAAAIAAAIPEAELDAGADNLGFAAGMNRLIQRSDAPWFLALNPDAWPEPGAVAALVAAGDSDPRVGAVAPRLERPDGTVEHSTHPFPSLPVAAVTGLGIAGLLGRGRAHRLLLHGAWDHATPRPVDWAVGAALLMRRAALDDVGGFDERFFMYVEDLDWCWRARQRGWQIRFEPAARVRHVGNVSGAKGYGRGRSAVEAANLYAFYRRHHGALATAALRACNTVGAARLALVARVRGDRDAAAHWRAAARAHASAARPTGPP